MKKLLIFSVVIIGIVGMGFIYRIFFVQQPKEKIYVAIEGEGTIVVIDAAKQKIIKSIDLSIDHEGGRFMYAPHNVQVSPDNKSVWVTVNATKHQDHALRLVFQANAHGENSESTDEPDEVIVINPLTDNIVKRISVAPKIHLAHIVFTPDSAYAYATAQNEGMIYKINAHTLEIEKRIAIHKDSEPHGVRIAPDGSFAYIAELKGKALGILNLKTDEYTKVPLDGSAVQTGVTRDGKFVFVSLYDTKRLAMYEVDTKQIYYVELPPTAKGALQMYPTPDSRFVYLADQGYYFEQPISEWIYKIEISTRKVVKEIKAGKAPHGVVVSEDGTHVYVTNLLSGDISIIDTVNDSEINRIKVGKEPNGISIWYKQ